MSYYETNPDYIIREISFYLDHRALTVTFRKSISFNFNNIKNLLCPPTNGKEITINFHVYQTKERLNGGDIDSFIIALDNNSTVGLVVALLRLRDAGYLSPELFMQIPLGTIADHRQNTFPEEMGGSNISSLHGERHTPYSGVSSPASIGLFSYHRSLGVLGESLMPMP